MVNSKDLWFLVSIKEQNAHFVILRFAAIQLLQDYH